MRWCRGASVRSKSSVWEQLEQQGTTPLLAAAALGGAVCQGAGPPALLPATQHLWGELGGGDRVLHPGQQLAHGHIVNIGLAQGVVCRGVAQQ